MSRRGWRDHPLVQLTLVRYREFFREPEAVFWVFVFPVLLTAGLGIAFRNQAPERTPVAVVGAVAAARPRDARRSTAAEGIRRRALDAIRAAAQALRTGEVALVVAPGGADGASSTASTRAARERDGPAAGGRRPCSAAAGPQRSGAGDARRPVQRARVALRRLRGARPAGHEPDGQRHLGAGLRDRGRAAEEAAQAADRDADVPDPVPGVVRPVPADHADHRGRRCWSDSRCSRSACRSGARSSSLAGHLPALGARVRRARPAARLAARGRSRACPG